MESGVHDNKVFNNSDCAEKKIFGNEFNNCLFKNCNFSNSDFLNVELIDCEFENCNMTMVKLTNAGLKNVKFAGCKLIGTDFSVCKDFMLSVNFHRCNLQYSFYFKKKMKNTQFIDCILKEANFTETDLTKSIFKNCDLANTIFDQTNLSNADFSTSYNFSIDPEINKMKKAKFSQQRLSGLLDKYDLIIE
jgi:uncharacterized protein YjbI with pentapeptide repeats